jgi:hypothetical protein
MRSCLFHRKDRKGLDLSFFERDGKCWKRSAGMFFNGNTSDALLLINFSCGFLQV